jgi:hypothetical protein
MSNFWNKVDQCEHKNISPDYLEYLNCTCQGTEFHCLDCGVYKANCQCGEMQGQSGWPYQRWKTYYYKKHGWRW